MALIGESAFNGNIGDGTPARKQKPGSQLYPMLLQPTMRRYSGGHLECFGKILPREATFLRDIRKQNVAVDIIGQHFLGAAGLGGRESALP